MELSRDSFLDDHVMQEVGSRAEEQEEAGFAESEAAEAAAEAAAAAGTGTDSFGDSLLFAAPATEEEGTGDVTPVLSDAERFWGASAAPEVVVAAIEDFMADFVEGLLRGELAEIELVSFFF